RGLPRADAQRSQNGTARGSREDAAGGSQTGDRAAGAAEGQGQALRGDPAVHDAQGAALPAPPGREPPAAHRRGQRHLRARGESAAQGLRAGEDDDEGPEAGPARSGGPARPDAIGYAPIEFPTPGRLAALEPRRRGFSMAVVIRMMRAGAKKRPFYRIGVADSRRQGGGRFGESRGY